MSDNISTEKRNFVLSKKVAGDVFFTISPASNPSVTRQIYLTNRIPKQSLPVDWALGVFMNPGVYEMYKKGVFTFDDNKAIQKIAQENGVYFDDYELDESETKDNSTEILKVIKSGNRSKIANAINTYGKNVVKDITIANVSSLPSGIVSLLEELLGIQLTINNA